MKNVFLPVNKAFLKLEKAEPLFFQKANPVWPAAEAFYEENGLLVPVYRKIVATGVAPQWQVGIIGDFPRMAEPFMAGYERILKRVPQGFVAYLESWRDNNAD